MFTCICSSLTEPICPKSDGSFPTAPSASSELELQPLLHPRGEPEAMLRRVIQEEFWSAE